jgi:hypothetical protein
MGSFVPGNSFTCVVCGFGIIETLDLFESESAYEPIIVAPTVNIMATAALVRPLRMAISFLSTVPLEAEANV